MTPAGRRQDDCRDLSLPAAIFTVFLCTAFGANAVAIKISLAGLGAFTAAGIRFSIAAVAISLWARSRGKVFRLKKGQAGQLLVISLCFTFQLSFFYLGLERTNASRATLIANLLPFFILILAHYFIPGDRITLRKSIGMALGFIGVSVLFLGEKDIAAMMQTGDLMILAASFIWSCNAVYTKRVIKDFSPFQIVLYPMIVSVPVFFLLGFWADAPMVSRIDPPVAGAMVYQGLVTASFGFVAWNTLLQRYGAVALHSFVFIMPVSGVMFGWLLLQEPITSGILAALVFVVAGILTIHYRTGAPPPAFPLRRGL